MSATTSKEEGDAFISAGNTDPEQQIGALESIKYSRIRSTQEAMQTETGITGSYPVANVYEREHGDSEFDRKQSEMVWDAVRRNAGGRMCVQSTESQSVYFCVNGFSEGMRIVSQQDKSNATTSTLNHSAVESVTADISLSDTPPGCPAEQFQGTTLFGSGGRLENIRHTQKLEYALLDSQGSAVDMRGLPFVIHLQFSKEPELRIPMYTTIT